MKGSYLTTTYDESDAQFDFYTADDKEEAMELISDYMGKYAVIGVPVSFDERREDLKSDFFINEEERSEPNYEIVRVEDVLINIDYLPIILDQTSHIYWYTKGEEGNEDLGIASSQELWRQMNDVRFEGEWSLRLSYLVDTARRAGGIGLFSSSFLIRPYISVVD
jgi:hypothetical protein